MTPYISRQYRLDFSGGVPYLSTRAAPHVTNKERKDAVLLERDVRVTRAVGDERRLSCRSSAMQRTTRFHDMTRCRSRDRGSPLL